MKELTRQKTYFNEGHTRSYVSRIQALKQLRNAILKHEKALIEALHQDLHKHEFEAYATEIGYVLSSIRFTLKHLKKWMQKERVKTPWFQLLTKSYIEYVPLGQVLIIGPFNYPFQLVVEPLIGAIAAGNVVAVKPSELTPHVEKITKIILEEAFPKDYVTVFTGGVEITQALLKQKFDHIFFTGSSRVGKIVYEAAAKQLTPVTLELGGKSPVIVDQTANLKVSARRLLYGKLMNAGQTCIAPDYVYVDETIYASFLDVLKSTYVDMFKHNHMGHIVTEKHVERLKSLLDQDKLVIAGDIKDKAFDFHVLKDITWDDKVMKEEIFGPILPILTFHSLDEVVQAIRQEEKPLALYIFSENKRNIDYVLNRVSFGSGAINDTIMQITNPHLPFGGVGNSGIGHYTGKFSFKTFSHHRAMINHKTTIDPPIAYPPYDDKKVKQIRKILK